MPPACGSSSSITPWRPNTRSRPDCATPSRVYDAVRAEPSALPVLVGGDSAGGGLATSLVAAALAADLPLPGGVALFSPWLDLTVSAGSYDSRAQSDLLFSAARPRGGADLYLQGWDPAIRWPPRSWPTCTAFRRPCCSSDPKRSSSTTPWPSRMRWPEPVPRWRSTPLPACNTSGRPSGPSCRESATALRLLARTSWHDLSTRERTNFPTSSGLQHLNGGPP